MKIHLVAVSALVVGSALALAEKSLIPPSLPKEILLQGAPLNTALNLVPPNLAGRTADIPTAQLLHIAQEPARDMIAATRSAKDAEIYRTISPSVVLVATKEGFGSGSLVSLSGEIITNWHVVRGYDFVAIVFKPATEGAKPGSGDMKLGRVVKYDPVPDLADLARVKIYFPISRGQTGE
jgi:S1-C subfamily serine protease